MADDGVTDERSDEAPEDGDKKPTADEPEPEPEPEGEGEGDEQDAKTCDECGAPLTSEVVDFAIASDSTWSDMGGAGEPQYAEVCSNEDCPTNRDRSKPAPESEATDD